MSYDAIKVGDFVTVEFPDTPYSNRGIYGQVRHIAQASGECWVIESCRDVHYVQTFVQIRKEKPVDDLPAPQPGNTV